MNSTPRLSLCAALLIPAPLLAQDAKSNTPEQPWKKLQFLLGEWTGVAGEKDTPLGAGQGAFTFELQLSRKIIVRRNLSEYDSGARHDDLMVIYLDPPNDSPRAIYFDSEGHVIRYNLAFPAPGAVVFESDAAQPGPRYRLSYVMEEGALSGKFEVAPPGAAYRAYMSWKARKN